jgi:tRNA A37 threonylcarbamoyladenosine synthetase subunit TsaC/SUA5/YrdC
MTEILALTRRGALTQAAQRLTAHQIIAAPGYEGYWLLARAERATALRSLTTIDGMPGIVLLVDKPAHLAVFTPVPLYAPAQLLSQHFWPGSLILVLPAHGGDQATVAINQPGEAHLRTLITTQGPLAALPLVDADGCAVTSASAVAHGWGAHLSLLLSADERFRTPAQPSTIIAVTQRQENLRFLRRGERAYAMNALLYATGYTC